MQKPALIAALLFVAAIALTSCESTQPPKPSRISRPVRLELPVRPEPSFKEISYSELGSDKKMVVLHSTEDLIAMLKGKFPALNSERAALWFSKETLIVSDGITYRRIWFSYGDEATRSMHGYCSQNINLWFASSGTLARIYVDPMQCPI
jgi:hypothetical protein